MALVRNFKAATGTENTVSLTWDKPLGFNATDDELIVTRTITHPPSELYNSSFPNSATDPRGIEIFRGKSITGTLTKFKNTKSILFGNNGGIDVGPQPNLQFDTNDAFSVSWWMNPSQLKDSIIFDYLSGSGWRVILLNTGLVRFQLAFSGAVQVIVDTDISTYDINTWQNFTITYDGSGNASGVTIYKNNSPVNTNITTNTLTLSGISYSGDFYIGSTPGLTLTYRGLLDNLSIWDTKLTASGVDEVYNGGGPGDLSQHSLTANILSWWRMGDVDTLPTIVASISAADGTASGDVSISTSTPPEGDPVLTLEDNSGPFPTNPSLIGRLLRDSNGKVSRIISNTVESLTVEEELAEGVYVVLPDFPTKVRPQENYEFDVRTESESGKISNLVILDNGALQVKLFTPGELANLVFKDANGDKYIIKDNTETEVILFDAATPQIGLGMSILNNFFDSQPLPYIDNFLTEAQAQSRVGSSLRDNQFYYYTVFTKEVGVNVAQAEFATIDTNVSTQGFALSTNESRMTECLYNYWPSLARELDTTGDLEDLMKVFGFQLNEIYALIDTYNLQDPDKVLVTALQPLSEQTGLPSVGFSIGADTLRRIARNMLGCWKLKGSKEGIAVFIRKITTWDVTNGTADFSAAIQDFLPNVEALRFFDPNLGSLNTRLTETDPFVPGGRFARSLPGIVIPGFFTFREFVVDIPNVALYVGVSENFTSNPNTTTLEDTTANFGADDSLVGNFLIPNTEEVNDIFEIVSNTATSITVRGVINNKNPGGDYAVLSPLNTNRFQILNSLLPVYIPFGTRAGFRFVNI